MSRSLKLKEIFAENLFRVPDYQRGYAWGEKQLLDFWQDIEDLPANHNHYTGFLFIEKSEDIDQQDKWLTKSGYTKFDIVDGQQRLTTITILLHELISLLGQDEGYSELSKANLTEKYIFKESLNKNLRSYIFSYASSDQNYHFMLSKIFEDSKELGQNNFNAYAKNLMFTKLFFIQKLAPLTFEEREQIFFKVTNLLVFDLREVGEDLEVQAIFETMNNRGKQLSILERLKNRLLYLTKFLNLDESELPVLRNKINSSWRTVFQELAKNPEQILDEDDFLISHLSLFRDPDESVFSYEAAEKKIFELFSNRAEYYGEPKISFSVFEKYLKSLSESAGHWYFIHNAGKKGCIKQILSLSSARELKILLLSVLLRSKDDSLNQSVFLKLEAALFRNRVPGMWVFDERQLATWARDIYNNEKNLNDLIAFLNGRINQPIDKDAFCNNVKNLFTYVRGNYGYHRWGTLKYFLFCYEDELRKEFKESLDKIDLNSFNEATIEHVIPQAWQNNWKNVFELNAFPESLEYDVQKTIINSLGNLTILLNGKNSSLGDKPWDTKQNRFKTGSYNEIEISKNKQWGISEIYLRGIKMVKFLTDKLGLLDLSENEIIELLFIRKEIIDWTKNSFANIKTD